MALALMWAIWQILPRHGHVAERSHTRSHDPIAVSLPKQYETIGIAMQDTEPTDLPPNRRILIRNEHIHALIAHAAQDPNHFRSLSAQENTSERHRGGDCFFFPTSL